MDSFNNHCYNYEWDIYCKVFKKSLKTEEGAEIDGYVKGNRTKRYSKDEDKDIEGIQPRAELGKPTLIKGSKKEAI